MIDIVRDREHLPRFLSYLRAYALNNRDRKCTRDKLAEAIGYYFLEVEADPPEAGEMFRTINGFVNSQLVTHMTLGRKGEQEFYTLTERGRDLADEGDTLRGVVEPQRAAPAPAPTPPPQVAEPEVAVVAPVAAPTAPEPRAAAPPPVPPTPVDPPRLQPVADAPSSVPTRRATRFLAAILPELDADGTCSFEVACAVSRSILEQERDEARDPTPISVPQVSSTVGRMVRDGYFTKEPTPFGKGVHRYRITDVGRRIAEQGPQRVVEQVHLPFVPPPAVAPPHARPPAPDVPARTDTSGAVLALLLAESRLESLRAARQQLDAQRTELDAQYESARASADRLRAIVDRTPAARLTYESASRCIAAATPAQDATPQ